MDFKEVDCENGKWRELAEDPVVEFGISRIEPLGSAIIILVCT
jgi:hypothetical protein